MGPAELIVIVIIFVSRIRHDLSPEKTSEIPSFLVSSKEAVRYQQILPAIVVDISKVGSPGPTSHLDARFAAFIGKATVSCIE